MTEIQKSKPLSEPEKQNLSLIIGVKLIRFPKIAPNPFGPLNIGI